jgi:hypothetical protein
MEFVLQPWHRLLTILAGLINRQQQVIEGSRRTPLSQTGDRRPSPAHCQRESVPGLCSPPGRPRRPRAQALGYDGRQRPQRTWDRTSTGAQAAVDLEGIPRGALGRAHGSRHEVLGRVSIHPRWRGCESGPLTRSFARSGFPFGALRAQPQVECAPVRPRIGYVGRPKERY